MQEGSVWEGRLRFDPREADAPELDEEGTRREAAKGAGEIPERDEGAGPDTHHDHGEAATEELRDVARDRTAGDGTDVTDNRRERGLVRAKALAVLCREEERVSVGEEVEDRRAGSRI